MNQALLRRRAVELKMLLQEYAPQVPDALKLQRALQGLLHKSLEGQLENPVEWKAIPGDHLFNEGTLSNFLDLSSAYSKFKVEATGGPSPVLQQFRSEQGFDPHTGDPA